MEELGKFVDDKDVLARLGEIKKHNKIALKKYLKEHQNIDIDENSIFDIQVKRLHEYKRQQMNVLYIIHKYLDIKAGNIPTTPITVIFGAKAAPANVEIHQLVGDDNIYIFGESSEEVINHYKKADYVSKKYYEKEDIKKLVDFIVSDEMLKVGDEVNLNRLYNELINKDWFMTLLDIEDYIKTRNKMIKYYEDREGWNKKVLINISKAGFFSSDRTIEQYNDDIWKLK